MGVDHRDWAHPPLPLGPKSRVLAEALAPVVLILVWRMILEPAFPLILRTGSWTGVSGFVRDRCVDACLLVPCAVAWMSASRFRILHFAQALAIGPLVAAWLLVAPRFGVWASGVVGLVLTVGLLELSQVRLRLTLPFRRARRAGALVRRGRTPESQLRRDLWLGPFTNNLQNYLLTSALAVALVAYVVVHAMSRKGSFVAGMVMGLSVAFLFLPTGVPLLGRQSRLGGTPLFGGSFVAAWAALPVRQDALLRGVYAHGLIWGCCVTLWVLTTMLTDGEPGDPWLLARVGLAASVSVAGALVCVAVGDRRRGVLSIGATVLALGTIALPTALAGWAPVWATFAPGVAAVSAGGLGGLPPLVHLAARPARNKR